jgi:hypothetical protein
MLIYIIWISKNNYCIFNIGSCFQNITFCIKNHYCRFNTDLYSFAFYLSMKMRLFSKIAA